MSFDTQLFDHIPFKFLMMLLEAGTIVYHSWTED